VDEYTALKIEVEMKPHYSAVAKYLSSEVRGRYLKAEQATVNILGVTALAKSRQAFAEGKQWKGVQWEANTGDWAMFKRFELGQNPVQVGIVNGALLRSISLQLDDDGTVCRVGSPLDYAKTFTEGGTFAPYWARSHRTKRWHEFEGGVQPARPFFPDIDWLHSYMETVFTEQWNSTA